jgi:hypothetical protein
MIISRSIILRIRNILDTIFEKIKTHIFTFTKCFPENRAVYEIVCGKYCTSIQNAYDNIIWCMHIAYWIPKATNIH